MISAVEQHIGRVTFFNPIKGFGFVDGCGHGDLFFSTRDVRGQWPQSTAYVRFELQFARVGGRLRASNVQCIAAESGGRSTTCLRQLLLEERARHGAQRMFGVPATSGDTFALEPQAPPRLLVGDKVVIPPQAGPTRPSELLSALRRN